MLSAPPASPNSASPSASDCATETIACTPEPQSRLTFIAGTLSGTPAPIAAMRERYMSRGSVAITCPKATLPICAGSTPDRSIAAAATRHPSSTGGVPASAPPKVPIAVRTPPKITTSSMKAPLRCNHPRRQPLALSR